MNMIDSHCHLYLEEFKSDIDEVMNRAIQSGVSKFYLPAIDSTEMEALLDLERRYPDHCCAMAGLHPCYVKDNYREELQYVRQWLSKRKFAAVGEIGLDFYWDRTFESQQYEAFEQQIEWAIELDLPIVIHSRESTRQCIDVVKSYKGTGKGDRLRGVFHCFSGNAAEAEEVVELGFFLGIGGVITYKNSGLAAAISNVSLDNILLETDAPYLTPVPYRGKRNESSYLTYVVKKLAELKNKSEEEVATITTENSNKLFKY
ncbi:MAG TPA: TatD family hydrolase [Parasegetibacter sp.]